jgi:hypothetical protein
MITSPGGRIRLDIRPVSGENGGTPPANGRQVLKEIRYAAMEKI